MLLTALEARQLHSLTPANSSLDFLLLDIGSGTEPVADCRVNSRLKIEAASTRETTMATTKKSEKGLEDLFLDGLKDIYYGEKKILKALPKMAKGAESEEVSAAFQKHLMETEGQVDRLEQVFEMLGKPARGKTCPAIDGIIEEGSEILEEYKGAPAIDAGLVAAAQAVEHYEIARYGTLIAWAEQLGMNDAVKLLQATLKEESATDEALTALGQGGVNERAMAEAA
jgi:ferritin-like metal-binding protein YciE